MDWQAFLLSLKISGATIIVLLPLAILIGRMLANARFAGKRAIEVLVTFPLVLPPTVLGYGLLLILGRASPIGRLYEDVLGRTLVFSFDGLLAASIIANLPFAILPIERAFASIDPIYKESAFMCGATPWQVFRRIELPLAFPGILSAMMITFAHTMGEFGAVLMIGGNIPGVTRTAAIALYDRVQAFDMRGAALMAFFLFIISMSAMLFATLMLGPFIKQSKRYSS